MQSSIDSLRERIELLEKRIYFFDPAEYVTQDVAFDLLQNTFGDIDICGNTYNELSVYRKIDPIGFSIMANDFISDMIPTQFKSYNDMVEELDELKGKLYDLMDSDNN